jgi:hypothetical protein
MVRRLLSQAIERVNGDITLAERHNGLAVNDGILDRQRGNGVPKAGGAFYYLRSQSRSVVDTAC